jgi:hypothetical protein
MQAGADLAPGVSQQAFKQVTGIRVAGVMPARVTPIGKIPIGGAGFGAAFAFVKLAGLPASRMSRAKVNASSTLGTMSRLSAPCARVSLEAAKCREVPHAAYSTKGSHTLTFHRPMELGRKQSSAPRFGSLRVIKGDYPMSVVRTPLGWAAHSPARLVATDACSDEMLIRRLAGGDQLARARATKKVQSVYFSTPIALSV